jgi:ferric-dicitrate binding protein FerR (iron transport regulator)
MNDNETLFAPSRRAILAGAIAMFASPAAAADPAGRVDLAKGDSTGLLGGAVRSLDLDSDVFLQEFVQTSLGARLGMALGKNTRVVLGERTRLKIERSVVDRGGTLLLERGALLFDHAGPSRGAGNEAVVRTPLAIIAARGTRFFVGPSNGVIGVFVAEGVASVRNRAGKVMLKAGQGTDLTSPNVAPEEAHAWGAARIAAALASVS